MWMFFYLMTKSILHKTRTIFHANSFTWDVKLPIGANALQGFKINAGNGETRDYHFSTNINFIQRQQN